MKGLSRDITLTLCLKLLLLVLLWWFCVKGQHAPISSNHDWFLGTPNISTSSPTNHLR